jgi:hypothetical protein
VIVLRGARRLAVALVFLSTRAAADAEDSPGEPDEGAQSDPPVTPPSQSQSAPRDPNTLPDFMRSKRRMRDEDLQDKVEGGYFTGLPLANSDPDTGFGFGARAYYFNNGPRNDRMFEYTPYRDRLYGQAFITTNGYQFHTIDYDAPYLHDAPVRLRASAYFEKNIAANYFGVGARSMGRLAFPGSDSTFAQYSDYADALRQLRSDGTAFTRFDHYIVQRPVATATVERDFFGGIVRGLVGFTASYVAIDQWSGESVLANDAATGRSDVDARQAPTRLQQDCNAGLVRGCDGGFNNALKFGVAVDTRDFEPDPNSGFFVDFTTELAGRPIGSEFDWARATFSPRVYYSPFPKLTDLVIAGRFVGSVQTADTPFFAMPDLSFTDTNRQGLGGLRTLRGYKQNRFIGRVVALANLEVRWTFVEFKVTKRQHFALMAVPFFDVGRVFDSVDDFEFRRFRNGQGVGLRIAWNQATIIVADYGVSREGSSLYINFNHPF